MGGGCCGVSLYSTVVRSKRVGVEHVSAAGGNGAQLHVSGGVVQPVHVLAVAARLTAEAEYGDRQRQSRRRHLRDMAATVASTRINAMHN